MQDLLLLVIWGTNNGWLQLLIMLKQALKKSPILDQESSIHLSDDQSYREQQQNIKTSLLTQILTSTQRSSNRNEEPNNNLSLAATIHQHPLFLDEAQDVAAKKRHNKRQAMLESPLFIQAKGNMDVGYSTKRVQIKAKANGPNCSAKCQIY